MLVKFCLGVEESLRAAAEAFVVCSLVKGYVLQMPSASALLLAASLHRCWQSCEVSRLRAALNSLPHQRDERYKQVRAQRQTAHCGNMMQRLRSLNN